MKIADYINALPDAYKKDTESNNYKLLLIEQKTVELLHKDIEDLWNALDLYKAKGETLNLFGEMYDKPRGAATDDQYRYLIAQKVAQNMVEGNYNSIVKAISVAFDVPPTEFRFVETENPAEVEVQDLPYGVLLNAGITVEQVEEIIQGILPAGVTLTLKALSGSFEFGGADEYDETAGFGNVEQTIGGYFGYLAN